MWGTGRRIIEEVHMYFMLVLLFGILVSALQGHCQGIRKIWTDQNEIWVETPAGPRQLTHDGIRKRLVVLSSSGTRLIYVVDDWSSDPQHQQPPKEDVVEIDSKGKVLRHIVPDGYVPEPFDRLEWIDNHRVGAMTCGHANCMYWMLDADSGRTLQVFQGGFDFIWSHNRRWVARRFVGYLDAPAGTPQEELDHLILNDEWIYPSSRFKKDAQTREPSNLIQGHSFGPFTWSPHDAWLGFTDTVTPEGDPYVVLVSPTGAVLRDTLPVDVQFDTRVMWTDDQHLKVSTSDRTFSFVVEGTELHELTADTAKQVP
jgi:hypothetical protein